MGEQIVVVQYSDPDILPATFLRWWDKFEQWAGLLGVGPNEVTASFKEKPRGLVSNNAYDLNRYRQRIQEQVRKGNVKYAALSYFADGWRYKVTDWEFYSGCGGFENNFGMLSSGMSVETLDSMSRLSTARFTRDAMCHSEGLIHIWYGMAVVMPALFMAPGYAMGVASGHMPSEFVYDANSWSRFAGKECGHVIRNVFGYNILNAQHLNIDVGGQRLGDWIEASADRGRIEPQDSGLFVWTFQEGDDEEAFLRWDYPPVVDVRERLKEHKIFPWQHLPGVE